MQDVVLPEMQDKKTGRLDFGDPGLVETVRFRLVASVNIDGQMCVWAGKIHRMARDLDIRAEFMAAKLVGANPLPQGDAGILIAA